MFEEINKKLIDIKGDMKRKRVLEMQLADYQKELGDVNDKIYQLNSKLDEEQADVEKLEKISVTNLFVTLLGKKEDRLDKEKQEVLEVQLKLDAALESKKDIENAISELQKKLQQVKYAEVDYEILLEEKEKLIKDSSSTYSRELFQLDEQEADLKAYLKELEEAIRAGKSVGASLDNAVHYLEKAHGWGTFDLLGGGMISDAIKHDHIDNAKDYIYQAQSRMRSFQKELLDVDGTGDDIVVDISGMLKFADFFFDGLIADWMVQGKINDSLDQTRNQAYKIDNIVSDLKRQERDYQINLEQILAKRQEVVETYQAK